MFVPESPLLIAVVSAVIGMAIIPWGLRQPTRTRIALGLAYLAAYTLVLGWADILPLRPATHTLAGEARILVQLSQLLWWFVLARCLIAIGRVFLLYKHKLHERKFATDLLAGFVYLNVCFAVIGFVFDVPVTGLLATSGVVAIVLGLALQSTVGDVFSGIALSLERPYRIGDAIGLEGDIEGTVIEISWRATHIMSGAHDDIVIPNSVIAKSRIVNYSFPVRMHQVKCDVMMDNRVLPGRGIEMLEHAVLHCRSVLQVPQPQFRITRLGSTSIGYSAAFFVDRFESAGQVKSDVLELIHRHATWAGIALGPTRQVSHAAAPPPVPKAESHPERGILERIPLFTALSADERNALTAALKPRSLGAGETLLEPGQPGHSLFLIGSGVLSLTRAGTDGAAVEISRLGPGDFFEAHAVLNAPPRGGTVRALTRAKLLQVPNENLASLLGQRAAFAEQLAAVMPWLVPPGAEPANEKLPSVQRGPADHYRSTGSVRGTTG